MPPRPSPPRLYLRKRRDGANTWIILDCGRQISTGALADDRRAAEEALENYLGQKHRPSFGDGHPARVAVVDVLSAYAEKHAPTTARPDLIAGAVLKLGDYFEGHMVATIHTGKLPGLSHLALRAAGCAREEERQADQQRDSTA